MWSRSIHDVTGGDVAAYDSRASTSRTEVGGACALVLILVVLSTLVLDAYAFSTFVG